MKNDGRRGGGGGEKGELMSLKPSPAEILQAVS
jgi:hypothetical protein